MPAVSRGASLPQNYTTDQRHLPIEWARNLPSPFSLPSRKRLKERMREGGAEEFKPKSQAKYLGMLIDTAVVILSVKLLHNPAHGGFSTGPVATATANLALADSPQSPVILGEARSAQMPPLVLTLVTTAATLVNLKQPSLQLMPLSRSVRGLCLVAGWLEPSHEHFLELPPLKILFYIK